MLPFVIGLTSKDEVAVCDDALCCSQSRSDNISYPTREDSCARWHGKVRYAGRRWMERKAKKGNGMLLGETDNEV